METTLSSSEEGFNSNTIFYHSTFRQNWKRTLERDVSNEDTSTWISEKKRKTIYICDNLKPILKKMDMHPDNLQENREVFSEYIEKLPCISVEKLPEPYTWYNRTTKGINLRPGRTGGSNRLPGPIKMKGQNSHAIIAGRTGSGKSVFLNNLILNMMIEYAPWELELYLADFKKVEMSRYMNNYPSPHVRACAATSEIDYVQSLIQFIKEKKDDREKLFARLGYLNIEEFREAYFDEEKEVVMPRILFLVDEFQQLFLDANTMQKAVIDDLITDITRKGRSQGVHLMFASQDMSGALTQKQLSNFKVRFALACDSSISNDVLGNNGATFLQTGQVIVNTKSKEISDNEIYYVPIAEDKPEEYDAEQQDEYFYRILKEFQDNAISMDYQYRTVQKFYDEDKQKDIKSLYDLLENPAIQRIRMFESEGQKDDKHKNFMSLVLGRKVVYSTEEKDIENFFIDYAKNRTILCLSGNNEDLAYFQRLITANITTMNIKRGEEKLNNINKRFAIPFFYDLNPVVSALYTPEERIRDFDCMEKEYEAYSEDEISEFIEQNIYYRAEELEILQSAFAYRKLLLHLFRNTIYSNAKEICIAYLKETMKQEAKIKDENIQNEYIEQIIKAGLFRLKEDDSNIITFMNELEFFGELQGDIKDLLEAYYRYRILKIRPPYKVFPPTIVWISGIENMERLPGWFAEFASNGLEYNFLIMFFSTTKVQYEVKQSTNYVFVAGNDPKLYDDYLGKKPPKGNNDIKFQCLIKNTNQKFAFKKYRCELNKPSMKKIDFDEVLNQRYE